MNSAGEGRVRLPRSERRAQLLQAAQEVFVSRGYHATSMDDIADRAGVSKPVLYQHFTSKLELYLALLDGRATELVERIREAMDRSEDNKERVDEAMRAYFDFVDAQGEAFRLVFESDQRNDPAVAERVARMEDECVTALADTIMADTQVDKSRAELLATGLVGAAEVAARKWIATGRVVPKDEAVALMSTLAWRGISHFPLEGEDGEGDRD
ncbi:TetR/AcrR family transcriptional regulator [Glycomyces arizonensis]|uniref:TetR/AcrR family transcriptional regulator n=1 Tax=Glycomyces arizonensis TaxID=256035 RepID=UPI00040D6ADA|nr:TetR/AcrR family transcriptional regulator [Glycomyces arizonensis]